MGSKKSNIVSHENQHQTTIPAHPSVEIGHWQCLHSSMAVQYKVAALVDSMCDCSIIISLELQMHSILPPPLLLTPGWSLPVI